MTGFGMQKSNNVGRWLTVLNQAGALTLCFSSLVHGYSQYGKVGQSWYIMQERHLDSYGSVMDQVYLASI